MRGAADETISNEVTENCHGETLCRNESLSSIESMMEENALHALDGPDGNPAGSDEIDEEKVNDSRGDEDGDDNDEAIVVGENELLEVDGLDLLDSDEEMRDVVEPPVARRRQRGQRGARIIVPDEFPAEQRYEQFIEGGESLEAKQPFERRYRGYGVNLNHFVDCSPRRIVDLLWRECMEHIVLCYNLRIAQEGTTEQPLTLGTLYRWYGMRLYMAIFKRPSTSDFFCDLDCGKRLNSSPNLNKYMNFHQFKEVKRGLRFEDYQKLSQDEKEADKIWKVRTIFNVIKGKCREYMRSPGEHISVDEAMVKYFGKKCPISKSMPQKPIKKGFLFYCAVDYDTKWTFDLNVYEPYNMNVQRPWGSTGQRVIDLIKDLPGQYRTVYIDNFYTSENLVLHLLKEYKTYVIGTVRKNRLPKVLPPNFVSKHTKPKPTLACPKGTMNAAVNQTKTVAACSLMDSGMVYFLDSAYGPNILDTMQRRIGGDVQDLHVYKGIVQYNKYMGGVDAADAIRTGYYSIEDVQRDSRWTVRFVDAMFNFTLSQAWIAYRFHHEDSGKYNRLNFMKSICSSFLDNDEDEINQVLTRQRASRNFITEFGIHHRVINLPKEDIQSRDNDNSFRMTRLNCIYCTGKKPSKRLRQSYRSSMKTTTMCMECGVPLHMDCHSQYHNEKL